MGLQLPEFLKVEYNAMTDEDLAGIVRICALDPQSKPAMEIVQLIAEQKLGFWRLRDDKVDVRLVLEICIHPDGNELLVWGVFGRGLFGKFAEILEFCKLQANRFFCTSITGKVYSKGLMKLYESIGAKPLYTKYRLEG